MSHPIAGEGRIGVRRVIDVGQTEFAAHRLGVASPQREQRPTSRVDPGESLRASASHEEHENRLRLVIGGVTGEHLGGQHLVAGPTGARLEIRPGRDRHGPRLEPGAESLGGGAHHLRLRAGTLTQSVIHVHGRHVETSSSRQHQQRHRIRAPRHRTGHGCRRDGEPTPHEPRLEPRLQIRNDPHRSGQRPITRSRDRTSSNPSPHRPASPRGSDHGSPPTSEVGRAPRRRVPTCQVRRPTRPQR